MKNNNQITYGEGVNPNGGYVNAQSYKPNLAKIWDEANLRLRRAEEAEK